MLKRIYRSAHHKLVCLILLLLLLYDSTPTCLVVVLRKSTMTFILLRRIDPSSDLFYGKSLGSRKSTWWFLVALTTHIENKYDIQMNGIFQLINNVIATGRVHLNISNGEGIDIESSSLPACIPMLNFCPFNYVLFIVF